MNNPSKIDWSTVNELLREGERRLADVLSPNPERVRQLQEERAARLSSRRRFAQTEETISMLLVEVAGERVALEVTAVSEVTPISSLAPVPGAPSGTLGVINLRGELYSVLDMRPLLRSERPPAENAWGVALRHPVLRIALGIDAVLRIENVPASALQIADDRVLRIREDIAILLDTREIFARMEAGLASETNFQDQQ